MPDNGSKQPHSVHQPGKARGQSFQHAARDLSQGRAEGFPGRGGAGHFVAREQAEQTGKRLHEFGHCQTHGHKNNVDARKGIGKRLAESLEHRLDTVHHAGNRGHKPHQSGGLDLRGQFAPDFSAAVLERLEHGKHALDRQRDLVPAFVQVIRHAAEVRPVCGIKQPQHGNGGIYRRAKAKQRRFQRQQGLAQHGGQSRKEPHGRGKRRQHHQRRAHGSGQLQQPLSCPGLGCGPQHVHKYAQLLRRPADGRQKGVSHRYGKISQLVGQKLQRVGNGLAACVELRLHGTGVVGLVPHKLERLREIAHVLQKRRDTAQRLLPEHGCEQRHLQFFGLGRYGFKDLENRSLRIGLHVLCQLRGGQADGRKGGGLVLAHGRALDQRGGEALERRRRHFRAGPGGKEGRAERRHLRFRQAADHGHRAHALDDFTQRRSRRVHVVGKVVHRVGQGINLRQCQIHTRAPVGHHLARLIARKIEGHAHFRGLFRELSKVLFGHPGLPGCGNNGRYAVRRHGDASGHIHDRLVHGLKFGLRLEVDHLRHVGHGRFKGHGLARRHAERPQHDSGGQRHRSHGQGKIAHALSQRRHAAFHASHGTSYPVQRAGNHVHQGQRGKYAENFHLTSSARNFRACCRESCGPAW